MNKKVIKCFMCGYDLRKIRWRKKSLCPKCYIKLEKALEYVKEIKQNQEKDL